MDRCNLTILQEAGQDDLAEFLAAHRVKVVASLPCYLEENVDGQRGKGVFEGSIAGLRRLNGLGYGDGRSGLVLDLVYNPTGPSLPPSQCSLEPDYKRVLGEHYGVRFDSLLTLTNMPIRRFGSMLQSQGGFADYMRLLRSAHRDENLESVMCRNLLSVDWQGFVYDCDFNQMLDMPLSGPRDERRGRLHISSVTRPVLEGRRIQVGEHCYGCTAGQGSSCGGALS
jgi:radical SAM/Cys-rich protein